MLDDLSLLDAVDFNAAPFDEWRMDENRELEELLRLPAYDLFTDAEREKEQQAAEQRGVSDRVSVASLRMLDPTSSVRVRRLRQRRVTVRN